MKQIKDDIWNWYQKGWHLAIPTNGWINGSGENPMGRGIALQANKIFHKLDRAVGNQLKKNGNHVFYFERQKLITFPTKENWRDDASLQLIEQSCKELKLLLNKMTNIKVVLPKVGCGWGKLTWDKVKPIVEKYLDEFGEERVMIVDNEQGDSKEYLKENKENVRDKKEPFKITYADTGESITPN